MKRKITKVNEGGNLASLYLSECGETEMEEEIWVLFCPYGKYEVSNLGRIRVVKPYKNTRPVGYILKGRVDHHGYRCVDLWYENKVYRFRVHVILMVAFVGECPKGQEVRHLDGNKLNNDLSNLKYGTRSENVQDMIKHGQHKHTPKGYRHTPEAIEKIRQASLRMWNGTNED